MAADELLQPTIHVEVLVKGDRLTKQTLQEVESPYDLMLNHTTDF